MVTTKKIPIEDTQKKKSKTINNKKKHEGRQEGRKEEQKKYKTKKQ